MKKLVSMILVAILAINCLIVANAVNHYYGDINKDDKININDVTYIQKYLIDINKIDDIQLVIGDVNGDGVVDIYDATMIQRFICNKIITLGPGNIEITEPSETSIPAFTDSTNSDNPSYTYPIATEPSATEPTETTPVIPVEPDEYKDMVEYISQKINNLRTDEGLPAYSVFESLKNCAYARSVETAQVWDNVRPDGRIWYTILEDLYGYNTELYYLSEHMAYMKANNNMTQTQVADAMVDALLKSAPDREIFLEEDDEVKGMFKSIGVGINFENNTYYMVIHLAG